MYRKYSELNKNVCQQFSDMNFEDLIGISFIDITNFFSVKFCSNLYKILGVYFKKCGFLRRLLSNCKFTVRKFI